MGRKKSNKRNKQAERKAVRETSRQREKQKERQAGREKSSKRDKRAERKQYFISNISILGHFLVNILKNHIICEIENRHDVRYCCWISDIFFKYIEGKISISYPGKLSDCKPAVLMLVLYKTVYFRDRT